jgi:hypothetical protein
MRLVYQMGRSRTNVRDQSAGWALPSPRSMIVAVPEGPAYVARCMRCELRSSSCEDGVDVKQPSDEVCKEWR